MPLSIKSAQKLLLRSSQDMFESGKPLMRRIIPEGVMVEQWEHYPSRDVVNGPIGCRWFYHCHPPEARTNGEHGHFHLFVDRAALPPKLKSLTKAKPARNAALNVCHLVGLSIAPSGLPMGWFTINQWVTDEWLFPAEHVAGILPRVSFRGRRGDSLVNQWLTAMVALYAEQIETLLIERDQCLLSSDPSGKNRDVEVTSSLAIDIAALFED
jgi:hypothetical protein